MTQSKEKVVLKPKKITPALREQYDRTRFKADQIAKKSTRAYEKPVLICYGDVRDITLGGSVNPGDPGVPAGTRRNS